MDAQTKVFRAHRVLAWFYAVLGIVLSAVVFLPGKADGGMIIVPLIFAGVFSMHFFTARACREGKEGGRVASIVIACLMLLGFPVGTLIGIYLLSNTIKPWTDDSLAA